MNFKKLEKTDKSLFDDFFQTHITYSDFNFTSLYSWDIEETCEFAFVNNNLAIKFQDYLSRSPFYSFIGNNLVLETVSILIALSKSKDLPPILKMVPEESINQDFAKLYNSYNVSETRDDFDYIYSLSELATLAGNKYYNQRNLVNRFKRKYPNFEIVKLDMRDADVISQVDDLFNLWASRKQNKEHSDNEHECFKRMFILCAHYNYHAIGIYVDRRLIGFAINEILNKDYVLAHYRKADIEFSGIYKILEQVCAIDLSASGYKYLNYEQDAGLLELRKSKQSWNPVKLLKKYTVEERT